MGAPQELILAIKSVGEFDTFVETGTYKGNTTMWAAKNFDYVYTVEFSSKIFEQTSERLSQLENVSFHLADSKTFLKELAPKLTTPTVFWLDAHWCSGGSYGEHDQCPLIEELDILADLEECVILIDDARLFLAPPPAPNDPEQYPTIKEVIDSLTKKRSRYVTVHDDVIIAAPSEKRDVVKNILHKKITEDWKMKSGFQNKPQEINIWQKLKYKIQLTINPSTKSE